jgi:hypothetical protein
MASTARNRQRSPAIRSSLCDVSASVEERAHALDMARMARNHQRSHATRSSLCDVSTSLEERAHALDMSRIACAYQRSPAAGIISDFEIHQIAGT